MQWKAIESIIESYSRNDGNDIVSIPKDLFRRILIGALKHKGTFDESYYLTENQDISNAIQTGVIASPSQHYYQSGYFEGRMPKRLLVDEKFYLNQNPDVAEAIRSGLIPSAQAHFDDRGFNEGRAPHADFSLF